MKNRLEKIKQSYNDIKQVSYENNKGQYHGFYQFFNLYDGVENKQEGFYYKDESIGLWKNMTSTRIRRIESLKNSQINGISLVFSVSK